MDGARVKNPTVQDARDVIESRATGQGNHRPTNHRPTSSSAEAAPPYPESGMGVRVRAIRLGNGPPASKEKRGDKQQREDRARPRGRRQQRTRMGETRVLPRVPWGADQVPKVPWGTDVRGWEPRQERQVKPPKNSHRRAGLQQQTAGDPTRPRASPPSEGGDGNASSRVNGRGVVAGNGFGRFLTLDHSNFS